MKMVSVFVTAIRLGLTCYRVLQYCRLQRLHVHWTPAGGVDMPFLSSLLLLESRIINADCSQVIVLSLALIRSLEMDIFRKMKKGLGLDSEQKKGSVLGSAPAAITYSSTFTEAGSIGISVENRGNLPVVMRVESKSAAFSAGVIVGDIVIGLNDFEVHSYEEFFEIYATLERPLIVRYEYYCHFLWFGLHT